MEKKFFRLRQLQGKRNFNHIEKCIKKQKETENSNEL